MVVTEFNKLEDHWSIYFFFLGNQKTNKGGRYNAPSGHSEEVQKNS